MARQFYATGGFRPDAKLIVGGRWRACALTDIDEAGAALLGDLDVKAGEAVVACIADVGALPGRISHSDSGRVIVEFGEIASAAAARLARFQGQAY